MFQGTLLELAFNTASALPAFPHIKNRSRAQEEVVAACLELDQPRRALRYIEQIDNWRRGAGYADFAFYCAQHGDTAEVEHYLSLANKVAEDLARRISDTDDDEGVESAQDWQRDRIRVKIANTYAWLGQTQKAAQFEAGVVDSESGKVAAVKAMFIDADDFDEQIRALDGVVATGNFDRVRNALEACTQLYNRFYQDAERRSLVEEKIKASWKPVPVMVRLELLIALAGFALDHGDQVKALDLVKDAQLVMDGSRWAPEDRIPLMARLAALRHRAGDKDKARSEADAALAMFAAERKNIVDIYRAGALRPLAEAYQSMGDTAAALAVYKGAVEEGVHNPNSRPRAEDLSATCCSMALHWVEPDGSLWARLEEIHSRLGDPW